LGKIDTVLSYVGGLFSLIFTVLAFFLGSYSTYKYELYVAESTLMNSKGQRFNSDDFGFFTYIAYAFYDWMDAFGIPPTYFTKLKHIHDTRIESTEQLDPTIVLKRIKHLEDISKVLMSEHREMCLYLAEPLSLDQAKKMRSTLLYYNELMINDASDSRCRVEDRRNSELSNKNTLEDEKYFAYRSNAIANESELQVVPRVADPVREEGLS
jgi:hypothetical protein